MNYFQDKNLLFNLLPKHYHNKDIEDHTKLKDVGFGEEGQLCRFLRIFNLEFDKAKDFIDNLNNIWDIDSTPDKYLPYIAYLVGIDFNYDIDIKRARKEIKNAVPIYKRKGTLPSIKQLVKGITTYDIDLVEFYKNILVTNKLDTITYSADLDGYSNDVRYDKTFRTYSCTDGYYRREKLGIIIYVDEFVGEIFTAGIRKLQRIIEDHVPKGVDVELLIYFHKEEDYNMENIIVDEGSYVLEFLNIVEPYYSRNWLINNKYTISDNIILDSFNDIDNFNNIENFNELNEGQGIVDINSTNNLDYVTAYNVALINTWQEIQYYSENSFLHFNNDNFDEYGHIWNTVGEVNYINGKMETNDSISYIERPADFSSNSWTLKIKWTPKDSDHKTILSSLENYGFVVQGNHGSGYGTGNVLNLALGTSEGWDILPFMDGIKSDYNIGQEYNITLRCNIPEYTLLVDDVPDIVFSSYQKINPNAGIRIGSSTNGQNISNAKFDEFEFHANSALY